MAELVTTRPWVTEPILEQLGRELFQAESAVFGLGLAGRFAHVSAHAANVLRAPPRIAMSFGWRRAWGMLRAALLPRWRRPDPRRVLQRSVDAVVALRATACTLGDVSLVRWCDQWLALRHGIVEALSGSAYQR